MSNPTKATARDLKFVRMHHEAGNDTSASQMLGAVIRRAMQRRDLVAAWTLADALSITPHEAGPRPEGLGLPTRGRS